VIDTTSLNEIKMRKRYHSLGCKIIVSKDLNSVNVTDVLDSTKSTLTSVNQIAQVAISLFVLLVTICSQIYNIIAPAFGWSVVKSLDPLDMSTPTTTQKLLWPFQVGLPEFLTRMDAYLFGDGNLLYHLTGMEYSSMMVWLSKNISTIGKDIELPFELISNDEWANLPVVKIGHEYWNNISMFVDDQVSNFGLDIDELEKRLATLPFGSTWSIREKLVYSLWSMSFHHRLLSTTIEEVFQKFGSVLTKDGESLYEGIQSLLDSLHKLWTPVSPLTGTTLPLKNQSPVLVRKNIGTRVLFNKGAFPEEFEFLSPDQVAFSLN
jgi:hypothetical protein